AKVIVAAEIKKLATSNGRAVAGGPFVDRKVGIVDPCLSRQSQRLFKAKIFGRMGEVVVAPLDRATIDRCFAVIVGSLDEGPRQIPYGGRLHKRRLMDPD